jgi:hypothetical protein
VWGDGATVLSWPGYIVAYLLMALGVYLISDVDFLVKQNKDLHDYQEIIFQDIYNLPGALLFPPTTTASSSSAASTAAATNKDKQLPRIVLNRHQRIIVEQTRRQGLKRGFSNPEFSAEFYVDLDDDDDETNSKRVDGQTQTWQDGERIALVKGDDPFELDTDLEAGQQQGDASSTNDHQECPTTTTKTKTSSVLDGVCEDSLSVTEEDLTEEDCTEEEEEEERSEDCYLMDDNNNKREEDHDDRIWEA